MLIQGVNQHSTLEVTLELCCDYLWQCWSWGVNWHSTWEVTLQLCWDYLWQCWSRGGSIDTQLGKSLCNFAGITSDSVDPGGVNWHSTWEVTLQLCWDYLWQCWSWGGWLTLNLGSHFATLLDLPLTVLILWGVNQHSTWEVTLQLCWDYLWQCRSWEGGQSTLNLVSHFTTLLGLPLTVLIWGVNWHSTWEVTLQLCWDYLWQCWSGRLINTQFWKSLCNFAGITSDNVDPGGGLINTQLGKSLCNFAGITSDNVDPGGSIDTQLGKSLYNFAGITSDSVDPGGSINTQLGKSLYNFAGITSDSVDPGGGHTRGQMSNFHR